MGNTNMFPFLITRSPYHIAYIRELCAEMRTFDYNFFDTLVREVKIKHMRQ